MLYWLISMACLPQLADKSDVEIPNNPHHDFDGDGWTEVDGDCNDAERTLVTPFRFYLDSDGDGYPSRFDYQDLCTWEEPLSRGGTYIIEFDVEGFDCDDANREIYPGALEVCDGVDNDCNREVDERITDITPRFYLDADGDGYGRPMDADGDGVIDDVNGDGYPDASVQSCYAPEGYVLDNTDCDDDNPFNFPTNTEICDGQDNNCNNVSDEPSAADAVSWYLDGDQDGFPANIIPVIQCEAPEGSYILQRSDLLTDCDDTNAQVNPDGLESCNGLDDDCNGLLDDDAVTGLIECYADIDADGFGDEMTVTQSCACQTGEVTLAGDCDDNNASVYPTASEFCNGLDDDCNGQVDDNALNPTIYYEDADSDAVGSSNTLIACPVSNGQGDWVAPAGYVEITGDCNDGDATVSPLLPELCSSGIDENCDGDETLGAIDPDLFWVDTDGDAVGDPNYLLASCTPPIGYVLVEDETTEPVDCDDSDATTYPGAAEVCNGKLDDCFADDGLLTPPADELDTDGDNYVACQGFDITTWQGTTLDLNRIIDEGVGGSGDCAPTDGIIFPGAPEVCDGLFQDCSDPDLGIESAPASERDDDGDGYVECRSYDPQTWQGSSAVIGGEDCDDTNVTTFPGAVATPNTNECFADDNADGIADCSLDGTGTWTTCEEEALLDFYGHQMDFVLVPAGSFISGSPGVPTSQGTIQDYGPEWGRKSFEYQVEMTLAQDFFVQTAEVTQGAYEAFYGDRWTIDELGIALEDFAGLGDDYPVYYISWHMAAEFANQATIRHNAMKGTSLQACYTCLDEGTIDVACVQSMDPYTCDGYRLPTVMEWEYLAKGDTEHAFWTPDGIGNIPSGNASSFASQINAADDCSNVGWYFDAGVSEQDTLSQYTLSDFAWYCANSSIGGAYSTHPVRGKLPSYYDLYDLHGNVVEWTHDLVDNFTITSTMPPQVNYLGDVSSQTTMRSVRGGSYIDFSRVMRTSAYGKRTATIQYQASGFRLVRTAIAVQ